MMAAARRAVVVLAVLAASAVAVAPADASRASRLAYNRQVAVHWCDLLARTSIGCTGFHLLFATSTSRCSTSRFAVYTKRVTRLLVAETCE